MEVNEMSNYAEGINRMWEEVEGKRTKPEHTEYDNWEKLKAEYYGKKCCAQSEWGLIDFDPDERLEVAGGEKLTYDEYLDIMKASGRKMRHYFELCYYNCSGCEFKGQIEKKSKGKVCFKRIFVSGMYGDGTHFNGKEDHVWMAAAGFEKYGAGDCLSFTAEVYRYLKTGNGKAIDFSLRCPERIKKIQSYEIPSDDELLMQSIGQVVCEVCMFNEYCCMGMCIADREWRENMKQQLFNAVKGMSGKL